MTRSPARCPALPALALVLAGCPATTGPGRMSEEDVRNLERARFEALEQHTFSRAGEDMDPWVVPAPAGDAAGAWLYFASTQQTTEPDLFRKPVVGDVAVEQLTTDPAADRFPRPRPGNPDQIAFATNRRGNWDLLLLQLRAAGPPVEVPLAGEGADEIAPAWDAGGNFLAYCSLAAVGREWDLRVLNVNAKVSKILGPGFLPTWNPKQDVLAFQRPRRRDDPWYGIWTSNTTGAGLGVIVSDPQWAAIHPSWSPDGQWIAYASVAKGPAARRENRWQKGDDIWVVRADGARQARLTFHDAPDYAPMWAFDGRIYFVSERGGHPNVWSLKPLLPE